MVRNIDAEDFDFHRGEAVFEGLDFLLHAALFVFREARLDEGVGGHRADGRIPRGELDDVREFREEIHRAVGDLGAVEVDLSELPERGEFGDILVVGVGFLEAEFLEVGKPGDSRERSFRDFGFARIEHDDIRLDQFEAGDEFVGVFGVRGDEDIQRRGVPRGSADGEVRDLGERRTGFDDFLPREHGHLGGGELEAEIFFQERKGGGRREVFDEGFAFLCTTLDPPREEFDFSIGELGFAHGRHVLLVIEREARSLKHQARGGVTWLQRWAVFSAGEEEWQGVHAEVAVALCGIVALHTLGFDDRLDGRDINGGVLLAAGFHGDGFGFSAEGVAKAVVAREPEGAISMAGGGNEAERGEQEKRVGCPAKPAREMVHDEHPHAHGRGGDAEPPVVVEDFATVATGPDEQGAERGGSNR